MSLIVDVNVSARVFLMPDDADFAPVYMALFGSRKIAMLQYSDELLQELKNTEARRRIANLERAGRTIWVSASEIAPHRKQLDARKLYISDDPHILALALAGGARLPVSHDQALGADFTNPKIIPPPRRGSVYKNRKHAHLIAKCCKPAAVARHKRTR